MNDATSNRESTGLALGGAVLLAMSGFFLFRDLALPTAVLGLLAAGAAGSAAVLGWPRRWPTLAPAALLAATAGTGLWFLAVKTPALLPALLVALTASAVTVLRAESAGVDDPDGLAHRLRWYGFGAALLAASWAFYFQLLTVGVAADSVARRLVPTLAWLAIGLAIHIGGRARTRAAAQTGLGLVAIAVCKAIFYDTTHLAGGLRVAVLAGAGALLLFAAHVTQRPPARTTRRPPAGAARELA